MTVRTGTPQLNGAAIAARHRVLTRIEHAAGAAFGCDDDLRPGPASRRRIAPTALSLATLAAGLLAAVACLI